MIMMVISATLVSIADVVTWPVVRIIDPVFFTYHRWTMFAARLCMWPFGIKVQVQGKENYPKNVPAIIVCNHQSQLDINICSTGLNDVNFKCTYKRELLYYPGFGSALWMAGHVSVKRGNKQSGHDMMQACADYIRKGVSILFFAEGTRLVDGTDAVGPFRNGAFKLAMDTGAPIIPVSISGARDLLPARGFPKMGYGQPVLTIHPPVYPPSKAESEKMSKDEFEEALVRLREESRRQILADMRPCDAIVPKGSTAAAAVSSSISSGSSGEAAADGVDASSSGGRRKRVQ